MRRPLSPLYALALALVVPLAAAQDRVPAGEPVPVDGQDPVEGQEPAHEPGHEQEPAPGERAQARGEEDREAPDSAVQQDEIRRVVAVDKAVMRAYVEPVEDHELMQAAVRGLLLDLDPHRAYLAGDDAESFDEQTRGNYGGLGVEI